MSRFKLKKIIIENFKAVRTKQTLDMTAKIPGLHFVKGVNEVQPRLGSNGSGKTTLWDAFSWCQWGRTPDGLKNPDVKPWTGEKKTRVKNIWMRNGEKFIVQRTANPNSLTLNGEDIGQDELDKMFLSYSVGTHTILLGQGQPLFLDLGPAAKLDLFTELLDLDKWEIRSKTAAEEVDKLETQILESNSQLDASRLVIKEAKRTIEELQEQAAEWEEENKKKTKTSKAEVEKLEAELIDVRESLNAKNDKRTELDKEILQYENDIDSYVESIDTVSTERRQLENVIARASSEVSALHRQLTELKESKSCPLCKQDMPKADLQKHISEIRTKIKKQEQIYDEHQEKLNKLPSLKKAKEKVASLRDEMDGRIRVRNKVDANISNYRVRVASLEEGVKHLKRALKEDTEKQNPYTRQIDDIEKRMRKSRRANKDLEEMISKMQRRLERAAFWVKGFKQCRLYALEEVLEELRMVTAATATEFGLDDWTIDYQVEKESKSGNVQRGLNVTVKPPGSDKTVKLESYSGGEYQRLLLIGSLALSEVLLNHAGIEVDFEALDEPTRHLSSEGVTDLIEFLPQRAERLGRKTFYTDHQAIESSHFASTVTVVRNHEGTTING